VLQNSVYYMEEEGDAKFHRVLVQPLVDQNSAPDMELQGRIR